MGAGRQGPEHDRRHHLPLVRPRRLRRRQGRRRTARWACPIAPTKRSASGCPATRFTRYKKWLLAKGLAIGSRARRGSTPKTQAAVDASVEFARQSADPDPEAGVLNTYAEGRGGGHTVLQPERDRDADRELRPVKTNGERGRHGQEIIQLRTARSRRAGDARERRHGVLLRVPDADRHAADRRGAGPGQGIRRPPHLGPRLADRRTVDCRRRPSAPRRRGRRRSRACRRWRRSTPSSTSRTRRGKSAR